MNKFIFNIGDKVCHLLNTRNGVIVGQMKYVEYVGGPEKLEYLIEYSDKQKVGIDRDWCYHTEKNPKLKIIT